MRRTRAKYHYALRQVRKDEDDIVRQRLADALVGDPSRSFWAEIERMRSSHSANSLIVDGCTDSSNISQVFLRKYRQLYTSVPYNIVEMQQILAEVNSNLNNDRFSADYICSSHEVRLAISRLNPHKGDGNIGLLSD